MSKTQKKSSSHSQLNLFAVSRAISSTQGRLFSLFKDGSKVPVIVKEVGLLGTLSSYKKEDDGKVNNPQRSDMAFLDEKSKTLLIEYNLRIGVQRELEEGGNIHQCDLMHVHRKISEITRDFYVNGGFYELGKLYAERILNGYWMWRNKYGNNLTVNVEAHIQGNKIADFSNDKQSIEKDIEGLARVIEQALSKGDNFAELQVQGRVTLGYGAEVYPSQEIKLSAPKTDSSRVYYKTDEGYAMLHPQKITNAIRTIDMWYQQPEDMLIKEPIAIEPYGMSKKHNAIFRKVGANTDNFFCYLDAVVKNDASMINMLKEVNPVSLFFHAVMLRGGVFGMGTKDSENSGNAGESSNE